MRRLPLALAMAAAIALTVVVKVHYEFPPTSAAVLRATYTGGAGYYYVTIEFNATTPPPVITIAAGTAVVNYDVSTTSRLGAVYLGESNGTAVTYRMLHVPMPYGGGVDSVTVYIETAMATTLWVSTDGGKTWAPVLESGHALQ